MKPKRCTAQYPFTGVFQNGCRCTLEVGHSGLHTIIPPSSMDYAPDDEPRQPVQSADSCPFCGCTATIIETVEPRDPEPIYHAECWRCGARGPVEDTSDNALSSWNTRVEAIERGESDALRAEVARLNAEIARLVADAGQRRETGPVQFGDDWPGVFIRGDEAFGLAIVIRCLVDSVLRGDPPSPLDVNAVSGLGRTLEKCNVG